MFSFSDMVDQQNSISADKNFEYEKLLLYNEDLGDRGSQGGGGKVSQAYRKQDEVLNITGGPLSYKYQVSFIIITYRNIYFAYNS